MHFLAKLAGLVFILLIAFFAALNRTQVQVTWSPVHNPLALPLYAIVLGALLLGFLAGSLTVWANTIPLYRVKWRQRKEIKSLKKALDAAGKGPEFSARPPTDFFPALPDKRHL